MRATNGGHWWSVVVKVPTAWRAWHRRTVVPVAAAAPVVDPVRELAHVHRHWETVLWLADTAVLAGRRASQGCAYTSADAEGSWDLMRDAVTHGSQWRVVRPRGEGRVVRVRTAKPGSARAWAALVWVGEIVPGMRAVVTYYGSRADAVAAAELALRNLPSR